jgi:hypothetical protein
MILLFLIYAVVALAVFLLAFRLSRRRRLVIALVTFLVLSTATVISLWLVDDIPAPGDHPYNPIN